MTYPDSPWTAQCSSLPLEWPTPRDHLRLVDAVLVRVMATFNLHIAQLLFGVRTRCLKPGHSVDHIYSQSEAVDLVVDCQLHRGIDVAPLLVTSHVHVTVVSSAVREPVNEPVITVAVENNRFVRGRQKVAVALAP